MHIITKMDKYYISTRYLDPLGYYETMVFEVKGDRIDWAEQDMWRTRSKRKAVEHHIKAVESYASSAYQLCKKRIITKK